MNYFIKTLNWINLFSLLMFIPVRADTVIINVYNGTLTDNICANQIFIAIIITLLIGIVGRIKKIARPETGLAIITESEKSIKILVPIFLIVCFTAFTTMKLSPLYLLICIMHTMGILNSSRIINQL